jgi:hypothetical protein
MNTLLTNPCSYAFQAFDFRPTRAFSLDYSQDNGQENYNYDEGKGTIVLFVEGFPLNVTLFFIYF